MSAWIVSKEHIDLIVHAIANGTRDGVLPGRVMDKHQAGKMLMAECITSVSYRYSDRTALELPGPSDRHPVTKPYRFTDPKYLPTAAELYKTIKCYCYQSCEHPGWKASEAKRLCDGMLRAIEQGHLPAKQFGTYNPAYRWSEWDAAPWGIDADELAKLRTALRAELRQPLPPDLADAPDWAAADWLRDRGHDRAADLLASMADKPKTPRQPRTPRRPSPMFAAAPALAARCGSLVELGRRFQPGRDDE